MSADIAYPIYVISKGRSDRCLTAIELLRNDVPFSLVVEPQEVALYEAAHPDATVLGLPFGNLGQGSIPARNWCWEHSLSTGAERHWILDDNLRYFRRFTKGQREYCHPRIALNAAETFTDRYTNIGISGLSYTMFVNGKATTKPITVNAHVYSCLLIWNALPCRWRGRYNEDIDLCLQIMAAGYCTVLINAFTVDKQATLTMRGGNTDELYQGDGRLKMARSLERRWPYVVRTERRWGRPQHVVKATRDRLVDTQLQRRTDIDWSSLPAVDEMGMRLVERDDAQ